MSFEWSLSLRIFHPGGSGWAPDTVWALWRKRNFPAPTGYPNTVVQYMSSYFLTALAHHAFGWVS